MPSFVVQQHDATRLHYDFRLEVDGVLRSWAVPRGPSLRPADKRLAVEVEDHPLSWGEFEGTIESGYGAGTVIVWDRGEYEPSGDVPFARALSEGHASFELHGAKLRGGWALRRMHRGEKPQWLLVKKRDDFASEEDVTVEHPESVLSGKTIEQIAGPRGRDIPVVGLIGGGYDKDRAALARRHGILHHSADKVWREMGLGG